MFISKQQVNVKGYTVEISKFSLLSAVSYRKMIGIRKGVMFQIRFIDKHLKNYHYVLHFIRYDDNTTECSTSHMLYTKSFPDYTPKTLAELIRYSVDYLNRFHKP